MRLILGLILSSVAAAAFAQGPVGNAAAGKDKISMCEGCHGIPDYRTAFPHVYHVPLIMGQKADYIVSALNEYKSGARSHPSMRAVARSLSDQDIADIAAYFSHDGK